MSGLAPGTKVRMKSGSEGWVRGEVVEYFDLVPAGKGYIFTGPGYKVKVLEGKHQGETLRLPLNYVEPVGGPRQPEKTRRAEMTKGRW